MKAFERTFIACVAFVASSLVHLNASGSNVMDTGLEVQLEFAKAWQTLSGFQPEDMRPGYRALSLNARSMLELTIHSPPHRDPKKRFEEQSLAFVQSFYSLYGADFVFLRKQAGPALSDTEENEVKRRANRRLRQLLQIIPVGNDLEYEIKEVIATLAVARAAVNDDSGFLQILTNFREGLADEFQKVIEVVTGAVNEEEETDRTRLRYRVLFEQVYRSATGETR